MRIYSLLLLPLVYFNGPSSLAQEILGSDVGKKEVKSEKLESRRAQRGQAMAKLRADKPDDAERILGALSPAAKDTPAWHLELAMNLIRMAYDARAVGDDVAAKKAAQRALKYIEKAERGYADRPARLSGMQELRGVLQEDFLGTAEEAEAYFREAVRIDPSNEAAKERVMRFDRQREVDAAAQAAAAANNPSISK